MRPFQAPNGLSHLGEAADEEEVTALEEPEKPPPVMSLEWLGFQESRRKMR